MKKFFVFYFLLGIVPLFAEGNLQFNQVKLIEFSCSTPMSGVNYPCSPSNITVPVGKVWKIEQASAFVDLGQGYSTGTQSYSLYINNSLLYSGTPNLSITPMWLPEGIYNIKVTNQGCSPNCNTLRGSINAIEFNIIP
jgi:hypothetical protein